MNRSFQPLSISQEVNRIFQSLSLNPRLCEDGTKPLRYTKLKSKGLIRLLQVQPALFNESDLHAFFHEAELESVPPYEAISYTWGSAVLPETLNFPEGHLKITENLASALKKFRFTDKVRFFWADAVCINQEDNVEKGHQVAMMNQIYKKAHHVLVWLGDGDSNSAHSMKGYRILGEELATSTTSIERADPIVAAWLRADELRGSTRLMETTQGPAQKMLSEDHHQITLFTLSANLRETLWLIYGLTTQNSAPRWT